MNKLDNYINNKEYLKAWDYIKEIKDKLNPEDALYYEGIVLSNLKRYPDSIKKFENLISEFKNINFSRKNQVYMLLGYLYTQGRNYERAVEYFGKVVEEDFNCSQAHCGLGHIYYKQKDYVQAIRSYKTAIQVDPENSAAHHSLGYVIAESGGDIAEAIYECQEAVRLNADSSAAYDSLAWCLYLSQNIELAKETISEALKKDPDNEVIKKHYTIIMNHKSAKV